MLRQDLYNSIFDIIDLIKRLKIPQLMEAARKNEIPTDILSSLMNALNLFSIEYNRFSEVKKYIIKCMDLDSLHDATTWVLFMNPNARESLFEINRNLILTLNYLPKFAKLIENETIKIKEENLKEKSDIITVILPEESKKISSAKRVSEAITSIINLYELCLRIKNTEPNELTILSADSGSDKQFDFMGLSEGIKELKSLVLNVWDRIVFHRNDKFNANIESLSKALPMYQKIKELEENDSIGKEQAEIFRRDLSKGISGLLSCGVIIPEMERESSFSPKLLMTPEQKLLTSPFKDYESENGADLCDTDSSKAELSEEELALLKKLKDKGIYKE